MNRRAERTVLVVEDESLLRMELVDELESAGWRTREAATGDEALKLLASEAQIDFLVTDIRLPGKADGWAVAEDFHARHPDKTVIYVSANPDLAHRRVPTGVFLSKPVEIATFLATCDRLVLDD